MSGIRIMSSNKFNGGGIFFFGASFLITLLFFVAVILLNPGALDKQLSYVSPQFTMNEAKERVQSWLSQEQDGKRLYQVHCAFCHSSSGKDEILPLIFEGRTTENLYATLEDGIRGEHHFSHLPKSIKLSIISYLRSHMVSLPVEPEDVWMKFLEEQ